MHAKYILLWRDKDILAYNIGFVQLFSRPGLQFSGESGGGFVGSQV